MQKESTVGIIGAGNVAWHLVSGLQKAGVNIAVVYSRTLAHAQALARQTTSATATDSLRLTDAPPAEVYIIAVPDQALPAIVAQIIIPGNALVAHTSGTQPLAALEAAVPKRAGVFYPLQTFSKEKEVEWQKIPICIEASSQTGEERLLQLAHALSRQVVLLPGEKRKQLHLAAVFACNFTNHLWGVAQEMLQEAQLPANLLAPLVQETMAKALIFPPFSVQTGPAQRGDASTIQAHLQLLAAYPQYQQVYQTLTNSIQTTAQSENTPFFKKEP